MSDSMLRCEACGTTEGRFHTIRHVAHPETGEDDVVEILCVNCSPAIGPDEEDDYDPDAGVCVHCDCGGYSHAPHCPTQTPMYSEEDR